MATVTHNDNGYKSRKWVGFLVTLAAIITCGEIMSADKLANVVIGITTAFGIFCGANVWRDQAAFKNGIQIQSPTSVKAIVADAKALADATKKATATEEEGS